MRHRFTALTAAAFVAMGACAEPVVAPVAAPVMDGPSFSIDANATDTYLVRFKGKGVPSGFAEQVAALGGEVVFAHAGVGIGAVSGLTDAAAAQLAATSGIAAVDADGTTELDPTPMGDLASASVESPTNPAGASFFARQWHLRAIDAQAAWAAGKFGDRSTTVGIIDTGIDPTHPDLAGLVDFTLSRSFSNQDGARRIANFPTAPTWVDLHYHGTHVAATVASNAIAAAGVTSNVTLVALKGCYLTTTGGGSCPSSGVLNAILYAADNGIDVVNMSLGGQFNRRDARGGQGFPSFLATINQVMSYANRHGTTIVVSAGNAAADLDHDGNGYKSYCSNSQVICVSATGPTARAGVNGPWTNIDALARYSNFGRSAINVAAPGGNGSSTVTAACSRFSLAIPICRTGTFVVGLNGTSMAAPHVSGLAALLVSEVGASPAKIQARLQQSADDLGEPGTDPAYGKGRINVRTALGL